MNNFTTFFENNNAQKQINELSKKYKNKKVVLYGAGQFFSELANNYDLSKLNVLGICDKRFDTEKDIENFMGYKAIKPSSLSSLDIDIIILTVQEYHYLKNIIQTTIINEAENKKIRIVPIIKKSILNRIIEKIEE